MKLRLRRPRSKDESQALNPEPTPEKEPLYIHYDKDGNQIGDDGYLLTPKRKRLHTTLDVVFIWAIISAVLGAGCAILAYAQGQEYGGFRGDFASFNLEVTGGNMLNGFSLATLMRIEAVMLIVVGIFAVSISVKGFHWLYDKGSKGPLVALMIFVASIVLIYQFMLFSIAKLIDPISLIVFVLIVLTAIFMKQVANEKPSLKKAKVARTEVRK